MRPVRLEVEGFTAFRARTEVDFTGADLFAVVGPTGAGKTSIIDALTFALYGTVPRLDDRRSVAPVLSQNLTEARVRLDFTVDGVVYSAARVVRRTKTAVSTKEARLERDGEVLAGTADEVTAAVTDLLGLSFEHFITCVSLPQGQFARFLHDKPASRQDLLVKLLGLGLYERVAALARDRGRREQMRAEALATQLEGLAGATEEARAAAVERVGVLGVLADRLAAERPEVEAALAAAAEADGRASARAEQAALLAGLAAPAGVHELAAGLADADAARDEAAKLDEEAAIAAAAAEARLAGLPDRALLDALVAGHRRHAELVVLAERGEAAQAEAAARLVTAVDAEATARAGRDRAEAELARVQVELRAQAFVPELVVGEACPVCQQHVAALPHVEHPPDLARASAAAADAATALRAAGDEVRDAEVRQGRVDDKLARVRDDLAEAAARLAADSTRLRTAMASAPAAVAATGGGDGGGVGEWGDGVVPLDVVEAEAALVAAATAATDAARRAERDARRAVTEATKRHEALLREERTARRRFDQARDAVAALGPPAAERSDLAADWDALVAWADDRHPALLAEADEHRRAAAGHRQAARVRLASVLDACDAAGVALVAGSGRAADGSAAGGGGAAGGWPGEAVAAARAAAEAEVRTIEQRIADAERLRGQERAAGEAHQVADALALHLSANRFEQWLLDEALQQLVAGATQILGELSAGAYALAVDGRGGFQVIDHTNASQARSARTLSGGETFLASLALALALADQVAGLAARTARLEALFLDEGFGTLDPDVLDVVASALDELGARGRMVGVVTHVRELADRLPVRFEVRKVGGAATVERVDL